MIDTFGTPEQVSFGKLRTTRIAWIFGLCLVHGLCGMDHLYAQGPELGSPGAEPSSEDRRGRRSRGGRGDFDPAQMIGRLDQDQNGVITESEVENAPGFARRMLQDSGLDFRRGVRVEELQQSAEQRISEMRRQRDSDRSDRSERPDRPDWTPPQSMGRSEFEGPATPPVTGANRATSPSSTSNPQRTRTRISPLLPDSFQAYDMDLDGQIALSEWRKGKRGTLSQFMQYDLDGDGFLIAKELLKASAVGGTTAAPSTASTNIASTTAAAPATTVAPAAPVAPVVVSTADAAKATRDFDLLDKDKSGTITETEWTVSRRLKPLFEKGGIDLAKPMTKDDFIQGYVRVGAVR